MSERFDPQAEDQPDPVDSLRHDPRWPKALALFNRGAWYEAHDAFEELWQEAVDSDRQLLQAIVQAAVAHVHLQRGNDRGATILLGESIGRLGRCAPGSLGLDLLSLRTTLADRLAALHQGRDPSALAEPRLIQR